MRTTPSTLEAAPPLLPHQATGVEFLRSRSRALLADAPGLGKSRTALEAADPDGPCLIIAPAYLQGTWAEQVELWAPGLEYMFTSYAGICDRAPDARGRMSKVLPRPRPEFRQPWATVIVDEAHNLKRRTSSPANMVKAAISLCDRAQRVYLLTGTPMPNWAYEVFVALRILNGPHDRRYTSFWRWAGRWFRVWQPPWGGWQIDGLLACHKAKCPPTGGGAATCRHWLDFWEANDMVGGSGGRMLRRTTEESGVVLPPMHERQIPCPMVPAQAKAYRELKKDYVTWIEHEQQDRSAYELAAWGSGGALHTQLAKIATGLECVDPGLKGSGKIAALEQLMVDREGHPLVVFCQFRNTVEAVRSLSERLGRRVGVWMGGVAQQARDGLRDAFQAGELDVLVGTIESMSEGLTLTRATTAIFVERSWRPSRNEQATKRIHRIGQTRPVEILTLITPGTVDERMSKVLRDKTDEQIAAMSAADFADLL